MESLLSPLELERAALPQVSDRALMERIAARIISELDITGPPVNMEMVASYCGIAAVEINPDLSVPGCLIPGAASHRIQVAAGDSRPRQRFTIGHECGHTFLPGFTLQPQFRCSPMTTSPKRLDDEALCDIAASSLLLPPRLVRPMVADAGGFGFRAVRVLADAFDASIIATASKLAAGSRRSAALLTFDFHQKPAEIGTDAPPLLRLRHVVPHGSGWPYFIPHRAAELDSAIERAAWGEFVYEEITTLKGLTRMPLTCEVHAELFPLSTVDRRVIVLIRQP